MGIVLFYIFKFTVNICTVSVCKVYINIILNCSERLLLVYKYTIAPFHVKKSFLNRGMQNKNCQCQPH